MRMRVLGALVQVLLVLPVLLVSFLAVPLVAVGLLRGGFHGGHPSWVVLGALIFTLWLVLAAVAVRRRV